MHFNLSPDLVNLWARAKGVVGFVVLGVELVLSFFEKLRLLRLPELITGSHASIRMEDSVKQPSLCLSSSTSRPSLTLSLADSHPMSSLASFYRSGFPPSSNINASQTP
eukprot:768358-Hanusia_phi.AAC.1